MSVRHLCLKIKCAPKINATPTRIDSIATKQSLIAVLLVAKGIGYLDIASSLLIFAFVFPLSISVSEPNTQNTRQPGTVRRMITRSVGFCNLYTSICSSRTYSQAPVSYVALGPKHALQMARSQQLTSGSSSSSYGDIMVLVQVSSSPSFQRV